MTQPHSKDDVLRMAEELKDSAEYQDRVGYGCNPDTLFEAAAMLRAYAEVVEYAERYRWLREHCRFCNDCLTELWFDACILSDDEPQLLDRSIDTCRSIAMVASNEVRAKVSEVQSIRRRLGVIHLALQRGDTGMAKTLAENSVSGWPDGWEEMSHDALTAALSTRGG